MAQWYRIYLAKQEMQQTWVRSLGQEDALEKEMETHSSILAWETPRTEELGGLQSMGSQQLDTTERLNDNKAEKSKMKIVASDCMVKE